MAPTNYYVDPQSGSDVTGDGSVSTPWQTTQHALNTATRDSANGDQINIKATVDDVLAAALSLATYGAPAAGGPLVFRGYTAVANDGGIGGIDGNGTYTIIAGAPGYVHFVDLHCHNSGSAIVLDLGWSSSAINCEIDNTTGDGIEFDTGRGMAINCYIHNCGGEGVDADGYTDIISCYFENGANAFTAAIQMETSLGSTALFNVIKLSGASNGIVSGARNLIMNNTVWCNGGTGTGIKTTNAWEESCVALNNIVEGFSGVGGNGIYVNGINSLEGYNAVYNNTTNRTVNELAVDLGDHATLSSSPFTDPASDDFSVSTDADIKADAFPLTINGSANTQYLDKGSVQRSEGAGGGGGRRAHIQAHGV